MHMDIRVCRKHEDQFRGRGGIQFESIKALLNVYLSGFRKIYSLWHIMGSFGLTLHELICKWFCFFMYTLWVATQTHSQSCNTPLSAQTSEQAHSPSGEGNHHLHNACLQTDRKPLEEAPGRRLQSVETLCNTTLFQTLGLIFKWNPKKRNFNLSQTLFFYR